jgi:hypothetical protein
LILFCRKAGDEKMGWWKLEAWKLNSEGETTDQLSDTDREHIAESIKDGCTSGEIIDEDEKTEDD